jgi:hypothetical protein
MLRSSYRARRSYPPTGPGIVQSKYRFLTSSSDCCDANLEPRLLLGVSFLPKGYIVSKHYSERDSLDMLLSLDAVVASANVLSYQNEARSKLSSESWNCAK